MKFPFSLARRGMLLLLASMAASGPLMAQDKPLVKVRFQLDWRFEAGAIPYFVAQKKGYFTQEGLDVTINVGSGASATITRLASGTSDMGLGDIPSVIEFAGNSQMIPAQAVFLVSENSPATIMSLKKSGIRTLQDLKGKTIGSPVNDGARKIFPLLAAANHLGPDDVKWMTLEPALRETMLVRGQVDAIAAYVASGLMSLEKLGVRPEDIEIMSYADNGVLIYGNAILATTDFIKNHPDAVRGFLRAVSRAMKDVYANRAESVRILKTYEPLIEIPVETTRLDIVLDRQIDTPNTRANGVGEIDLARMQQNIDLLAQELKFKSVPKAAALVNMTFLPSRNERLVFAHAPDQTKSASVKKP